MSDTRAASEHAGNAFYEEFLASTAPKSTQETRKVLEKIGWFEGKPVMTTFKPPTTATEIQREFPPSALDHARAIDYAMTMRGCQTYEIGPICSRNHVAAARLLKEARKYVRVAVKDTTAPRDARNEAGKLLGRINKALDALK